MFYGHEAWQTVGDAGFSAGGAEWTRLALHPSTGAPFVAYSDGANSNKTTVMCYDNGAWSVVGKAGFSAGAAWSISLAVHPSSGAPYVAYGASGEATVMFYDNEAWETVGDAGFSAGAALSTSLALHPSSGAPYVAYSDPANSNKTTVMCYDNGAWSVVGKAGFSAGAALSTSLALHPSSGAPYVAYQDGSFGKSTVMTTDHPATSQVSGRTCNVCLTTSQDLQGPAMTSRDQRHPTCACRPWVSAPLAGRALVQQSPIWTGGRAVYVKLITLDITTNPKPAKKEMLTPPWRARVAGSWIRVSQGGVDVMFVS